MPLLFGYSDKPIANTEKIGGCFFKGLQAARDGQPISLSADVIGCGGGKLYTGFSDIPERVPGFVSLKEKYKKTPEMVVWAHHRLAKFKRQELAENQGEEL